MPPDKREKTISFLSSVGPADVWKRTLKKSTLKSILLAGAAALLLVLVIAAAGSLEKHRQRIPEGAGARTVPTPTAALPAPGTVSLGGKEYLLNPDISTLLLIGVDDQNLEQHEGPRNQALADYLVLAVFQNREKTCTMLQIDRNTMAEVPVLGSQGRVIGETVQQICYAHVYGDGLEQSCENTVAAVSHLLCDIPLVNYLSLTMGAIPVLNDTAGGVTVTIEDDFTGVDDTLIQGQTVHLTGEHAFAFVHERMRLKDDSNTARMRRQATYVEALVPVLREKIQADPAFVLTLYEALSAYLVTNCAVDTLTSLSGSLAEYTLKGFVSLEGTTGKADLIEFYPEEEKLHSLVQELFCMP